MTLLTICTSTAGMYSAWPISMAALASLQVSATSPTSLVKSYLDIIEMILTNMMMTEPQLAFSALAEASSISSQLTANRRSGLCCLHSVFCS